MRLLEHHDHSAALRKNARELFELFSDIEDLERGQKINLSLAELCRCRSQRQQERLVTRCMLTGGFNNVHKLIEYYKKAGEWRIYDTELFFKLVSMSFNDFEKKYLTSAEICAEKTINRFMKLLLEHYYETCAHE